MAGDSYLLKVPTPPCQASHACRKGQARPTSCGVVVFMVMLFAAVLALGVVVYHLRLQLCSLRDEVSAAVNQRDSDVDRRIEFLYAQMTEMDTKLSRLNTFQQIKTFEAEESIVGTDLGTEDLDDVDVEDKEKDDLLPVYDEPELDFGVENRVNDEGKDRPSNVPRLEPAGGLQDLPTRFFTGDEDDINLDVERATPPGDGQPAEHQRDRREVASASASGDNLRAQPQLKLYHMLQNPGLSAAAPAESWSYHGSRRPDHYPQPMYAEHAPTDFVTPPRRHTAVATPATPIASRRSRVMDAGNPHEAAPRQRHRNRAGRRQHLQQQPQQHHGDAQLRLQDVSQDAGRSVEVRRYDGHQRDALRRGPGSSHGGPYWRGARVTDSFHRQGALSQL